LPPPSGDSPLIELKEDMIARTAFALPSSRAACWLTPPPVEKAPEKRQKALAGQARDTSAASQRHSGGLRYSLNSPIDNHYYIFTAFFSFFFAFSL